MALSKPTLTEELKGDLLEFFQYMRENPTTEEEYAQKLAETISERIIDHFTDNAEITLNIPNPANDAMAAAVPIPTDGGVGLQTTFLTYMATIASTVGTGTLE